MKVNSLLITVLVCSFTVQAQPRTVRRARSLVPSATQSSVAVTATQGRTLPIRRVILYSNGVAYIERRGTVSGHAEVNLSFKQSQVDDVLKSMVVLDLGEGRVGAVSYNSSAPPAARMADIPFSVGAATGDAGGHGGLAGVLTQLQGARVSVTTTAARTVTGSILTVEQRRSQAEANKPPIVTPWLVIASENGELSSFALDDVRSVKLIDEGARRDITEFASATASARRRDAKTITVTSDGAGTRELLVSYTIAAPIWKTTYRVVLDQGGQPFFQGWAIVDNVSDEDWTNIQLSLISGTPISFIQPIQQPFYRYRPVIPIPDDLKLEPQVYDPSEGYGMNTGGGDASVGGGGAGGGSGVSETVNVTSTAGRQVQSLAQLNSMNNLIIDGVASRPDATTLSDAITSERSGVSAAAEGAEVGDLFQYQISQPVTVKRDRSALIPILQTRMEGARVSIYNEQARRDRPMSGMLLKNTSALTLEDGALTVIDGNAYAGEALMERLKPQEKRLISFALDLGTLVNVRQLEDRAPAFLVRVVNGVFQAHYHREDKKLYTLTNQTDKPRVIYVEHPVRQGWELAKENQAQPEGRSARYYRFRVELAPFTKQELTVNERQALMDAYALSNFTPADLQLFLARRYVDEPTRAALQNIIDLKARIVSIDARTAAIEQEIEAIGEDQKRLRENITALNETAEAKQLITRYVAKADQQETRIEELTKEKQTVITERARLQTQLDAAIRALSLDRNLGE
ncbi:MAG: hypothetical protein M3Q76_11310 [Acidobacteriota bacterium]|nr:hypothetical protein [Acidobacteriota bacterium]